MLYYVPRQMLVSDKLTNVSSKLWQMNTSPTRYGIFSESSAKLSSSTASSRFFKSFCFTFSSSLKSSTFALRQANLFIFCWSSYEMWTSESWKKCIFYFFCILLSPAPHSHCFSSSTYYQSSSLVGMYVYWFCLTWYLQFLDIVDFFRLMMKVVII